MPEDQECPAGGHPLKTINATHEYRIHQEEGKCRKTVGLVTYQCETCNAILSVGEIEDILRQVDEL